MKWVTRERPKIDRIACPWLILRFIDRDAEFLYVPADDVLRTAEETGATPYDIPGVEMCHVGERCSFDAFVDEVPARRRPGAAAAGADRARRRHLAPGPDAAIGRAATRSRSACRACSPTTTRCCATAW